MTLVGKSTQQGQAGHGSANHDVHSCELCDQIESELAPSKPAVRPSAKSTPVVSRTVEVPRPPGAAPGPAPTPAPAVPTPPAADPAEARPVRVAAPAAVPAPAPAAAPAPAPAPAPTELTEAAPDLVAPREDPPTPTPLPPHRRGRTILVICAVVAIIAAGSIAFAVLHSSGDAKSPGHPAAASAPAASGPEPVTTAPVALSSSVAAAIEWARVQLPHDVPIVADPQTGSALSAAGFTQVGAAASTTTAVPTFVYLFDTAAVRAAASANQAIAAAVSSSVAVADFGSAADQVDVRQAVTDSAAVVGARKATDATTRRTAEQELLRNPAVTASGNAVAALQQGQLDLRAATVLAYLANSTTVRLGNVSINGPEQAAGLPVRSIDVTIGAPAVMQTIVSGLPVAYQPTSVTQLSTGAARMVWPIAAEPLPGLS